MLEQERINIPSISQKVGLLIFAALIAAGPTMLACNSSDGGDSFGSPLDGWGDDYEGSSPELRPADPYEPWE